MTNLPVWFINSEQPNNTKGTLFWKIGQPYSTWGGGRLCPPLWRVSTVSWNVATALGPGVSENTIAMTKKFLINQLDCSLYSNYKCVHMYIFGNIKWNGAMYVASQNIAIILVALRSLLCLNQIFTECNICNGCFLIHILTVFPRIVSAETILFWDLGCDKYSKEESIQRRKLFFSCFLVNL